MSPDDGSAGDGEPIQFEAQQGGKAWRGTSSSTIVVQAAGTAVVEVDVDVIDVEVEVDIDMDMDVDVDVELAVVVPVRPAVPPALSLPQPTNRTSGAITASTRTTTMCARNR
jgi:hypothetical protein